MALPSVTKTYQYNVNTTINAASTDTENFQRILLGIKNALIGFGTLPWTVVGSSNGTVAAMDAVDRWSAYTNLVWNTGASARSWIVLKNTGLGANFQMLLCLTSNSATAEEKMDIVLSPSSGFTGSSTTARPTAADEVVIHSAVGWIGTFTTNGFTSVSHIMKSTDGEVTRWMVCNAGKVVSFFSIEKAADPVTGWTVPVVTTSCISSSIVADHSSYANLNDLATSTTGFLVTTVFALYWTAEGFIAGMNGEQLNITSNEISAEWMLGPVGLASTTAGKRGRHGRLYDIWWSSELLMTGTTYPDDATRLFATFGNIVVPWNGSIPVVV